jgi:hypothetical protein
VPLRSAWLGVPGLLGLWAQGRGAGELWPQTHRGGGPTGSSQLAVMADGEWRLGHEEVVRDPVEVGVGSTGLTRGCPQWCGSAGRSQRWGRGPVVASGAGVVGDGLRIGAGQSMAGGGGAHGGTHDGSGGGDLAVEAWAGGGWTRCSPKWAGDREPPAIEEADGISCFGSWRPVAPDLVTRLVDARRRTLGRRQQLVTGGTAHWRR